MLRFTIRFDAEHGVLIHTLKIFVESINTLLMQQQIKQGKFRYIDIYIPAVAVIKGKYNIQQNG